MADDKKISALLVRSRKRKVWPFFFLHVSATCEGSNVGTTKKSMCAYSSQDAMHAGVMAWRGSGCAPPTLIIAISVYSLHNEHTHNFWPRKFFRKTCSSRGSHCTDYTCTSAKSEKTSPLTYARLLLHRLQLFTSFPPSSYFSVKRVSLSWR